MSLPNTLAIQDIIRFCALALPDLDGDARPSETEADSREAEIMASAFGRLSVAHPEAGAVYWACRTWLLWMWQPVYLGVWAASVKGASPDFSGFAHTFDGLFTARFGIAVQDCTVRLRQEAVSRTATDLKAYLYRLAATDSSALSFGCEAGGIFPRRCGAQSSVCRTCPAPALAR